MAACSAGDGQGTGASTGNAGSHGQTGAAGSGAAGSGAAGSGASGDSGAAGTTGAAGAGGDSGTAGTTGAAGTGVAGSSGSGGSGGSGGSTGAGGSSGTAGTTGAAGSTGTAGATGTGGSTGTAGTTGAGGTGAPKPTGMSAGCGMPPGAGDSPSKAVVRTVHITGLNAVYLGPSGTEYVSNGIAKEEPYNYTFRPYGLRLPKNYDPSKAYAVTFGGGGCGGSAAGYTGGGGMQIDNSGSTIQIGLQMMNGCFDDGGPTISNRNDTPELPYFRAVLADVEAHYCVDKSKVFVSGSSSGAWEAYTLGCAAGDVIRGISADEGGMRNVRPPCTGPVAAVLVAGTSDTENPIGPLDPNNKNDLSAINRLGSYGSAPGRDDLLMRNGCVGNATTAVGAWDAAYPQCVKYTGCPEKYPVIWCALPGVGHNASSYNGTNYSPGPMWKVLGSLPAP